MPPLIAIVSTTHGAGHGTEVVLGELLRAWRDRALPVTVAAPRGSAVASVATGAGIPWVPFATSRDALLLNLLAAERAAAPLRGVKLVHAWSARALELSWWLGRRLGVPATATVHDHPDSRAQGALRRRLWRRAANRQAAMAFPSAALATAWRAAGFNRRSVVVHNGSSGIVPGPRPGGGRVVIGFLGMYAAWKGFAIAGAWARAGWPEHVRWAFYGRTAPELADAAAALARELGPRATFAGERPRSEIFGAVDVVVHCSTAFDPFPTVLLEAAEAGIPAVAAALGGAGEIVVHGETGFLFDPAAPDAGLESLRRLVADAPLRARLGAAARARYERLFRAERMAEGYAGFWGSVLGMRKEATA